MYHGVAERDARNAVQELEAAIRAADEKDTLIERHYYVESAIRDFRQSAYGKLAMSLLHRDGLVLVPLFSAATAAEKTSQMRHTVVDKLLTKNEDGDYTVSNRVLKNEPRITGETRFMIKPGKLGPDFVCLTEEMAYTLGCILIALAYGAYEHVETEHTTVLLNDGNVKKQVLHRDHSGEDIDAKMRGGGRGPRSRPQAPPFSALCAFQENTVLHSIDGSHLLPLRTQFDKDQTKQHKIPVGWACLFHAAAVHAGMGSSGPYHARVHMYLKPRGVSNVYGGKIQITTGR